jgi:hypothetical protein
MRVNGKLGRRLAGAILTSSVAALVTVSAFLPIHAFIRRAETSAGETTTRAFDCFTQEARAGDIGVVRAPKASILTCSGTGGI